MEILSTLLTALIALCFAMSIMRQRKIDRAILDAMDALDERDRLEQGELDTSHPKRDGKLLMMPKRA